MPRPTVTVYAEVSADGKTTHALGASSKPMMSFEDDPIRRFRHELRARSDAIMVGSNTVRLDNPSLTVRHVPGPNPLRVVPATVGDLPLDSTILNDGHPTIIAISGRASTDRVAALQQRGANVIVAGTEVVDLALLLAKLLEQGIRSLSVEGGLNCTLPYSAKNSLTTSLFSTSQLSSEEKRSCDGRRRASPLDQ